MMITTEIDRKLLLANHPYVNSLVSFLIFLVTVLLVQYIMSCLSLVFN